MVISGSVDGGAIYNDATNGGSSSPLNANCVFVNNAADTRGGVIYTFSDSFGFSQPEIFISTFYGNTSFWDGALHNRSFDDRTTQPLIHNIVFWGNSADKGAQIYNDGDDGIATTEVTISHTLLGGGISGISENGGSTTTNDGGIISVDPEFVGAGDPNGSDGVYGTGDDGLHLRGGGPTTPSIAIDSGDNGQIPSPINGDIVGNARIIDGYGDGTSTVDLGPYE